MSVVELLGLRQTFLWCHILFLAFTERLPFLLASNLKQGRSSNERFVRRRPKIDHLVRRSRARRHLPTILPTLDLSGSASMAKWSRAAGHDAYRHQQGGAGAECKHGLDREAMMAVGPRPIRHVQLPRTKS